MKSFRVLLVLIFLIAMLSCKKELSTRSSAIPPNLTETLWQLDTILINSPAAYDNLTDEQKFAYNAALAWASDKAQLNFRNDGKVNCSGDWDFGYTMWQLINNDKDIKVNQGMGDDTLKAWHASDAQFSYTHSLGMTPFDCTFIYK